MLSRHWITARASSKLAKCSRINRERELPDRAAYTLHARLDKQYDANAGGENIAIDVDGANKSVPVNRRLMTSRSRNSSTVLHCLVDNEQYFNVPAVIASRSDGCDCKSLNAITWLVRFLLVRQVSFNKDPSPSDRVGARAVSFRPRWKIQSCRGHRIFTSWSCTPASTEGRLARKT